jgi:TetR/AcrR family tetracycline transcriptional repressor
MAEVKRRPGRPALIDRGKIVDAALELEAAGHPVSMQAVAARLGVPRGTLYHHVADREEVAALVAVARLREAFDEAWMPAPDADWRTWVAAFARVMREALITHGTPVDYVLLEGVVGRRQLAQVEKVLAPMVRDGFTPRAAMQALTVVAEVVTANARAEVVRCLHGTEAHDHFVASLGLDPEAPLPLLAAGIPERPDHEAQFAVSLDVVLAGITATLGPDAPAERTARAGRRGASPA